MKKCDFCEWSNSKGKCYWDFQSQREEHCRKAIRLMSKTLEKGE